MSAEKTTPKTLNVTGFQLRFSSDINFNLEFLRDSIHTAVVLSKLMFRPDVEAKFCKVCIHEQIDSLLPSRKNVVSSANCESNISSSKICIP